MFYKISLCIIFVFSFSYQVTQANEMCEAKCMIYEGTPDIILDYRAQLRQTIANISAQIRSQSGETGIKRDISRLKNSIISGYNTFTNWDGYFSYFRFYVSYPMKNENITQIWRDYEILNLESKGLERYIKHVSQKGLANIPLTQNQICNGITNCAFQGTAIEVLIQLEANHESFKEHFRRSILGTQHEKKQKTIFLVGDNFYQEFLKYYNENTTKNCSLCGDSYWSQIKETMERIDQNMSASSTGIQEWKNAWDLLVGGVDESEAQKIERNLLKKELGRQGVSSEQGKKILQNLDNFNETGLSGMMSNNFLTNSFDYFLKMITPQINEFDETILQSFQDESGNQRDVVSITGINNTLGDISNTSLVQQRIDILYQQELSSLAVGSRSIDESVAKLIEMHYDISKSIEYLNNASQLFEQVCLYQANGIGKCN